MGGGPIKRKISNKHWGLSKQAKMLSQLSKLVEKGYTLSQALSFIAFQLSAKQRSDIKACLTAMRQGNSLHSCLLKLNFHRDVLSYLYFAEQHGDLHFALKESSYMLSEKIKNKKRFQKLVQYPLLLLGFILGILFILSTVLLPHFQSLYKTMGHEQSPFLLIFMSTMSYFPHALVGITGSLLLIGGLYLISTKKLAPVEKMNILMKVPFMKQFTRLFNSYFFAVHTSNLLKGGLSIYECLSLFQLQQHYPFFREEAKLFTTELAAGKALNQILQSRPYYQKDLAEVVIHGQKNGDLAEELYDYSLYMVERMEEWIFHILKYIQPITFAFIGIVILLMYMSVMMPMLEIMSSL